ncbi:MAG: methylmalonyl-CoA mutase family protein [Microscillaceae bacterium]|jgi:methylmalonyl-CoA mutase|nr:methylmalonyl-CoA mutase family protein [Microscillaceae bacterium]
MNFFAEFSPTNQAEWTAEALKIIKQAGLDILQTPTYEGITLRPFYTAEDSAPSHLQAADFGSRGNWLNQEFIQSVDNQEIISLVKEALAKGAEALCIDTSNLQSPDYEAIVQEIPAHIPIKIKVAQADKNLYQRLAKTQKSISLDFDFLGHYTTSGTLQEADWQHLADIVQLASNQSISLNIQIHSEQFVDAGSNVIQELGCAWAMAGEYIHQLTERGVSVVQAFAQIEFCAAIGSNYFMEIAKFRAWRTLGSIMQACYKIDRRPIRLHARPAQWNKTQTDIYNNMLRATTEAMSAVIGGVDALSVLPYNTGLAQNDDFARRIARNISTILKEESHLNKVTDAAAGAYYIEQITKQLVEGAWQWLHRIEQRGGFLAAFGEGFIQDEIEKIAQQKRENFANKQDVLVGTNKYENKNEKIAALPTSPAPTTAVKVLKISRLSEEVEKLKAESQA